MFNTLVKYKTYLYAVFFTLLIVYLILLEGFMKENSWWIFLTWFYVAFFIINDNVEKIKDIEENLKIKKLEDTRINFWN